MFKKLLKNLPQGGSRRDDAFLGAVKLIHASEFDGLDRFVRYQDYGGTTYLEYQLQSERIGELSDSISTHIRAQERLAEIDHDEMVEYDVTWFDVPGGWIPRKHRLPLRRETLPGTRIEPSSGTVDGIVVTVNRGFFRKSERVAYSCPSNVAHADEIGTLRQKLASISDEEAGILDEVSSSRFRHPILFISHRWASIDHPDPDGRQLERLRSLKDCWVIYDYSSFPQAPRSPEDQARLDHILDHMDQLVGNVVVLSSPDYLERGWCIYEYMVSSFKGSVVCDEIGASDFVALREWVRTRPPIPTNLFRDSHESMQQNHVNEEILNAVSRILPVFQKAQYTEALDRATVRKLLRGHLKSTLPPKKEHQPYFGEWKTVPWTDEDLECAFETELEWARQQTISISRYQMDVPATVAEATRRGYAIKRASVLDQLKGWARKLGSAS